MGVIRYKDLEYGGGSSVVEGYYKIADGKFYEHFDGTTYSDEIAGADKILYVDLSTNNLYRWSTGASLFVLVGNDTKVTQDNTTSNVDWRVLLSASSNDTPETNIARKSNKLVFNPSTGKLKAENVSGTHFYEVITMPQTAVPITAGWRRVCKLNFNNGAYSDGIMIFGGAYNTGAPTDAVVAFTTTNKGASMTILSNARTNGNPAKARLVQADSNSAFWLDIYMNAVTGSGNFSRQYARIIGNVVVTDEQNSSEIISETVTERAIVTFDTKMNGNVLTDEGGTVKERLTFSKTANQLLTGTGTTGQDKGSGQTNRYVPSTWSFNSDITPTDGDEIMIKIPAAGISYGVWLSVDNGTTYYPVGRNDTSRLQTQFANGTTIHLVFQTNANMTIYDRTGSDSSSTYTGNYWKVVNYYDTNDNTVPSAYCTTAAGTAAKTATCTNFKLLSKSYLQVLIQNANTSQTALTLNVNSTGAKAIYINGSASSSSNYTLPAGTYFVYYESNKYYFRTDGKLTGDVTGTAAGCIPLAGSSAITGDLVPSTDDSVNLGSSLKEYAKGYFHDLELGQAGTTSGHIEFYDAITNYRTQILPNAPTSNKVIFLPKEDGTLATQESISGFNDSHVGIWSTGDQGIEADAIRVTMKYGNYRYFSGLLLNRYGAAIVNFGWGATYSTGFAYVYKLYSYANETFTATVYSSSSTQGVFQIKSSSTWNNFCLIGYLGGSSRSDVTSVTMVKT